MARKLALFCLITLWMVSVLGGAAVPAEAQEDPCEMYYQQVSDLLEQSQQALANGNAPLALSAAGLAEDLLALCAGTASEPVFFPAGNANRDWTPVTDVFNGVEMMRVPAGCFLMGSEDGNRNEQPVYQVCFETPFWIDKTEVTRAMYAACVAAGACSEPPASERSTQDNQPINRVTWFQAYDYCAWQGAQLPTEAQWEYAARGPEGRVFPWGKDFLTDRLVYSKNFDGQLASADSYPRGASWVGALHMSGNVWEWVNSIYKEYPYAVDKREDVNDTVASRVRRGGSYYLALANYLRGAKRFYSPPTFEFDTGGFRCARAIMVAEPGDTCEMRYQQAADLLVQSQEALANRNVIFAFPAVIAVKEILAPCVETIMEPVDFPAGSSNQDWTPVITQFNGVDMAQVPAGCFMMGSADGQRDEQPVHEVCFENAFWIDKTEVTRAMYDECVEKGICTERVATDYSFETQQPVNGVTWLQASDYCAWRGARLSTEAEWEYAARGPDGLVYPQGDTLSGDYVVYGANSSEPARVGSKPEGASWVGALDLGGNVWEWVADWYDASYYSTLEDGSVEPTGPTNGSARVIRGGSFADSDYFLRAAVRGKLDPETVSGDTGFRCAQDF